MITTQKGEFVAECNNCGDEAYGGVEDKFAVFVAALKEKGWGIRKDEDTKTWEHFCPECVDKGGA